MSTKDQKQNEDQVEEATQPDAVENDTASESNSDISPDARTRLGQRLSQARKSRELGLNEVCERLRIRKSYLEALESGDWKGLPEEVYAIGFLRQYAALLDLDVNQEIEALKSGEYRLTRPFTMPDPPIAMSRTWAIAAVACFLVLLILFNVVDNGEKEKSTQSPTLAPAAVVKQAPVAPGAPPAPPVASPGTAQPASANAPTSPTQVEPPAQPQTAQTAPAVEPAATAAAPASKQAPAVAALPKQPAVQPPAGDHIYQLTAVNEDVWLQLYDPKGGRLLKEVLLRRGQSLTIRSPRDYLLLTAGNPRHLSLSIDGVSVAAAGDLGRDGKVLRDYRFQLPDKPAVSGH